MPELLRELILSFIKNLEAISAGFFDAILEFSHLKGRNHLKKDDSELNIIF